LTTIFPKKRPVAADYFDQSESGLTTIEEDGPLVKKQWMMDKPAKERLIAALQKEHTPAQDEEPQATLPEK
jgi:hypothetical protein